MICPNCSATNGDTNRFCRECGFRLEGLARPSGDSTHGDEVALGQELFNVWQLFEAGDLESALREGEAILRQHPESASAHSLVALIYERRAEQELARGGMESALPFFRLAIAQYERILDLNPDSTADREKLASLRARISEPALTEGRGLRASIKAVLKTVPVQFAAAFAAFLVVLIVLIVLIPGGGKGSSKPAEQPRAEPGAVEVPANQNLPTAPPEPQLRVYTFPAAPAAERSVPTPPEARTVAAAPQQPRPSEPAPRPVEIKVVPEQPAPRPGATGAAPGTGQPQPREEPPAVSDAPAANGSTALARAIELYNSGRTAEAISVAQQAIALFQADLEAGRNTSVAQRGIENARKLVKVWQQSIVVTAEEQ